MKNFVTTTFIIYSIYKFKYISILLCFNDLKKFLKLEWCYIKVQFNWRKCGELQTKQTQEYSSLIHIELPFYLRYFTIHTDQRQGTAEILACQQCYLFTALTKHNSVQYLHSPGVWHELAFTVPALNHQAFRSENSANIWWLINNRYLGGIWRVSMYRSV